jgi:flagellar hook assembly protein FlgD
LRQLSESFQGRDDDSIRTRTGGHVRLIVADLRGHRVQSLVDEELPAARHVRRWDGRDAAGRHVVNGVYQYYLETENYASFHRMLLLK